jgi:AraC family transcriptional regulator
MTTPTEQTYRQRILQVQLFIQEHLDEELHLDRLARVAHFSPYHFHRIFRGIVGESVTEYVRRLRLESAAVAPKSTDWSVLDIALRAGYNAHEAFSRAFRQMFGASPSQYRAGQHPLYVPKEVPLMSVKTTAREVRIETVPTRRLAFLRHLGPYTEAGPVFDRLMAWAGQRGLFGRDTVVLGICPDDPEVTASDKIRFDCCVSVGENVRGEGEIGVQTLEGGECAVLTHYGPYSGLGEAYRWLFGTWLPTSGLEPRNAPPFEVYLNNPCNTPPDQLRTDIYVPLEPR